MAFQSAAGHGSLPNGAFSPVIYSKKTQLAFRKKTTVGDITNNDYFGEIANFGDSVQIMKEPEVAIQEYARGTKLNPQDLDDEDFTLVVDKANAFSFKVDDIEKAHSHIDFQEKATNRAAYNLADQYDMEVLGYLCGYKQSALAQVADTANDVVSGTKAVDTAGSDELLSSMKLKKGDFGTITTGSAGDHSIPVAARLPGATSFPTTHVSPAVIISRMATLLDKQYVPREGRWLVLDPDFCEVLMDEDSRFLNGDWGQNGGLYDGNGPANIYGFRVYKSNNLPSVGTGAGTSGTANQNSNFGVIVAGHESAVATAEQINKVEVHPLSDSFGDRVNGLHLYGRKILRPEGIVTAKWNMV